MALKSRPPKTAAFLTPRTSSKYSAVLFFTTLDLTKTGTDGNPPMSPAGKQALLDAIHAGLGFVGVHELLIPFIPSLTLGDLSNRYIAHGENEDPYLRMLGGEFILHGRTPRLQEPISSSRTRNFPASKA